MWRDVASIYRTSKKKKDINWFTEWLCRPPAAVVVFLLKGTRITPNQLTLVSFVLCAAAAAVWAGTTDFWSGIVAVAVFEISFIFDCADGQLARIRGQASKLGHLLDFLTDELKAMLVFAAISVRLWQQSGDLVFLLGGLAGLYALASGLSFTTFMRRPEYGAPPPTEDGQPAVIRERRGVLRAISGLEHAARTVVHYPSYIWICAVFDRLDIYFWAYGAVNILYFGRSFAQVAWRLGRSRKATQTGVGSQP